MNIKTKTKKDGSTVYTTQLYLGRDSLTGKPVRTTITGKTKKEVRAKAKAKTLEFEQNGRTVSKKLITVRTFGELFKLWWETYVPSVKIQSANHTKKLFNRYILPAFENIELTSMTTPLIQQQVNEWSKLIKNFNLLKSYTSNVMAYGVSLGIIEYNPCRDVILPKVKEEDSHKNKYLTDDQVKVFNDYLDSLNLGNFNNHYDVMLYRLALASGCRVGELVALEWSDVDFNENTINVNKTYNDGLKIISTPKNKTSRRIIHIDNKTMLKLKAFRNAQRVAYSGRTLTTVFYFGTHEYPEYKTLSRRLTNHLKNCGLPRVTFHAFRHTHASLLVNNGIDFKTLSDRLGHANINMTLNLYSHLSDEKRKTATEIFEKAINF